MRKVIGILQPFEREQCLYVYEDGNQLDLVTPTLDKFNETLFALCKQYETKEVVLRGPKQYNRGLIKKIQEEEKLKNVGENDHLNFTII